MDFNKLDESTKQKLHEELIHCADILGGKNPFLKMIEEIRAEKPNPLLNKTGSFHTTKTKVTLSKSMFKDTFSTLFDAIRREERSGDMLDGINPKEYKITMNMMRALNKTAITIASKDAEFEGDFTFNVLDTSEEKKTKVTFLFKAIFFYHLDEAKKALAYKA